MLPEIAHADETVTNSNMRDALAIVRGCATGVRANGTTAGSTLWTELLQRDGQCRHIFIKKMGTDAHHRSNKGSVLRHLQGTAASLSVTNHRQIIGTTAKKYGVAPTTLNRLLAWA